MWGDDDINFDLKLENFGVDVNELRMPVHTRVCHAWMEDWEKEILKINDCVAEAKLLEKYKGLVFFNPDNKYHYTICSNNLEFFKDRNGDRCVIGVPADDKLEDEPFFIDKLVHDLVIETPHEAHIRVIAPDDENNPDEV
ncbi:hypothetical protein ACHAWF_016725 [Thalassiosira exigua]